MILQVLNLSKVSTVFCSPQCKSQPSSLGSRPSGTVLNLVGTSNFKVINYIKRGQNYYVVTIYYFLQNWYQLNNKNSKFSEKDGGTNSYCPHMLRRACSCPFTGCSSWWFQLKCVKLCLIAHRAIIRLSRNATGSRFEQTNWSYRPPRPVKEIRDEMRERIW